MKDKDIGCGREKKIGTATIKTMFSFFIMKQSRLQVWSKANHSGPEKASVQTHNNPWVWGQRCFKQDNQGAISYCLSEALGPPLSKPHTDQGVACGMRDTLQCSLKSLGRRKPQQTNKQSKTPEATLDSPHELTWNSPHVCLWFIGTFFSSLAFGLLPQVKPHWLRVISTRIY